MTKTYRQQALDRATLRTIIFLTILVAFFL
jgi:hypothetical protein